MSKTEELISLAEYAQLHGIDPATVRQRALRGAFKTARKIGRNWVIDKNEVHIDHRFKQAKVAVNISETSGTARLNRTLRRPLPRKSEFCPAIEKRLYARKYERINIMPAEVKFSLYPSYEFELARMEGKEWEDEFKSDLVDDDLVDAAIDGRIVLDGKEIGYISIYLIGAHRNFVITCDDVDPVWSEIASIICTDTGEVKDEYLVDGTTIAVLDTIFIEEEYRGKGIGLSVLKDLPRRLKYEFQPDNIGTVCAVAYWAEAAEKFGGKSKEYKAYVERLVKLFEKAGFKHLGDDVVAHNVPDLK